MEEIVTKVPAQTLVVDTLIALVAVTVPETESWIPLDVAVFETQQSDPPPTVAIAESMSFCVGDHVNEVPAPACVIPLILQRITGDIPALIALTVAVTNEPEQTLAEGTETTRVAV